MSIAECLANMALTSKEQALFTRSEDTEDEISGVLGTRDAQ